MKDTDEGYYLYNIGINQCAIKDAGLLPGFTLEHGAILSLLFQIGTYLKPSFFVESENIYYNLSYKLIIEQLPILDLKKDSVYRRIKEMQEMGIVKIHPNSKTLNATHICITDKARKLNQRSHSKKQPTAILHDGDDFCDTHDKALAQPSGNTADALPQSCGTPSDGLRINNNNIIDNKDISQNKNNVITDLPIKESSISKESTHTRANDLSIHDRDLTEEELKLRHWVRKPGGPLFDEYYLDINFLQKLKAPQEIVFRGITYTVLPWDDILKLPSEKIAVIEKETVLAQCCNNYRSALSTARNFVQMDENEAQRRIDDQETEIWRGK